MRKYLLSLAVIIFYTVNCSAQDDQNVISDNAHQKQCGTSEYMQQKITQDPMLEVRCRKLDDNIDEWMKNNSDYAPKSVITIPVVVHIVYNTSYPEQDIADSVVQEQIDVLNSDFAGLNSNPMGVFPDSLKTNTGIQFCLAQRDPDNNPSTGIERRETTHGQFNYNDDMKHFSTGGLDQWDPDRFLNIWVCDLDTGISGYSYDPPVWPLPDVYGAAIDYQCFGISGAVYPWNLGHITTHEIGHCFHLAHIWGDDHGGSEADTCVSGNCCNGTDHCDDTPNQSVATTGHHTGLLTDVCANTAPGIMYMNFMDYSYDEDLADFTPDQSSRMQYSFLPGHYLNMLANSDGCIYPCDTCPPVAAFTSNKTFLPFMLDTVKFYDQSIYSPTNWQWSFAPSTVTYVSATSAASQNPQVKFNNVGFYSVTLITSNAFGSDTCYKFNYINNGAAICDSISNPSFSSCADSLTYYTSGSNGYITGNNNNGNLEIAQKFNISTLVPANYSYCTAAWVRAIKKGPCNYPNMTYVKLYSVGDISNAPEYLLGTSMPVALTYVNTECVPECWNEYAFFPYVELLPDVYVSVVLPNTYPTDTLVVFSTEENCYSYDSLSTWEKWGDQSWHSLGTWQGENMKVDLAIFLDICSDVVVGNEETPLLDNVTVYPNPAKDMVNVSFGAFLNENAVICIYNIMGESVKRISLDQGTDDISIDLSGEKNGIYLMSIQSDYYTIIKKIILIP